MLINILRPLFVCVLSLLSMSVAAGQSRLEKDDTKASSRWGTETTAYHIKSEVLKETRRVLVSLPASFAQTARRYPVILAFDGEYLHQEA
jgi:enterochelin esterase-like enzyme